MAMFETVADVLHQIIALVPWREEAHKLSAHEAVDRELGTGGAHTATTEQTSPESGTNDQAAANVTPADGTAAKARPGTTDK